MKNTIKTNNDKNKILSTFEGVNECQGIVVAVHQPLQLRKYSLQISLHYTLRRHVYIQLHTKHSSATPAHLRHFNCILVTTQVQRLLIEGSAYRDCETWDQYHAYNYHYINRRFNVNSYVLIVNVIFALGGQFRVRQMSLYIETDRRQY